MDSVLADAIELLDRQVAFLLKQQGPDFFMHLPAFIEALGSDPRLEAVLEDLYGAVNERLVDVNSRRATVMESLLKLRLELVTTLPEVDDGHFPRTSPGDAGWSDYQWSLARFDELATDSRARWPNNRRFDTERDPLDTMLGLLNNKVNNLDHKCELPMATPLRLAIGNVRRQFEYVRRDYDLATMTSGPVACLRLQALARELNPDPMVLHEPMSVSDLFRSALGELYGVGGIVREYLFQKRSHSNNDEAVAKIASGVRHDVECFHEEARRRLGLRRSLRGIVDRYAARAMWHDAARLRELADGKSKVTRKAAPIAKKQGKAEELLTADFARYLHDQGLSPLTNPMTGGLRPDVLAPMPRWTFYAEAKQYKDVKARAYLVKGVHQVWDTLGRLRGTPYEVREAFYVVFRRGGPRFVMPDVLRAEGATVYPVLIDIAEGKVSGQRQKLRPVMIGEGELVPRPGAPRAQKTKARVARGTRRAS